MMEIIKVKRSGGKGWHWINKSSFDPNKHEIYEEAKQEKQQVKATMKKGD